jgi:hypothetical protein
MENSILETMLKDKEREEALSNAVHDMVLELINELKDNEKDVLIRRFGLQGKKNETLEQIGQARNVTRERIRQIEKSSVKKLQELYLLKKELKSLEKLVSRTLEEFGGMASEDHLLDTLLETSTNKEFDRQALLFALKNLFKEPKRLDNHENFHPSWHLPNISLEKITQAVKEIEEKIKSLGKTIDQGGLEKLMDEIDVDNKHLNSYVKATNLIEQNSFGQWGLASWSTIRPRRVGDKVYLVLKESNKPLHFKEITDMINEIGFGDGKIVNIGTVHNELIMDDRYVLIGRGVYALKDWGYDSGTVSDIIIKLLKEKGPMSRQDIIDFVSKQRMIRENTVKVSLMNKALFKKVEKHKYDVSDDLK